MRNLSTLINLQQITKTHLCAGQPIHALKNINLQLQAGTLTAIMGKSGSGKSTLMHIIGLLDRCSSGKYYLNDKDTANLTSYELANLRNLKIGFVFQSFYLLPHSNVIENVQLPLFYRHTPPQQAQHLAMTALQKVGIAHLALRKPNQLSGGQQQRVAIARALVGNPEIILADEPTGALDAQMSSEIMDLLVELHRIEKRTIVIITHDQAVSQRCEQVLFIQEGELIHPN